MEILALLVCGAFTGILWKSVFDKNAAHDAEDKARQAKSAKYHQACRRAGRWVDEE